ncbi:midasin MDN1 [Cryptosporidium canis]|uniref:Midasin n=1 Tax=Cryptosporidium canis TaxID=195482 RepID=A0A9D5DDU1_9CRYT|nr:midasin MDN1 [Cryptosporidium canis]
MSLKEKSEIVLKEVLLREERIRRDIGDENYVFGQSVKGAVGKLERILSGLESGQLQGSEADLKIQVALRRLVLYSEVGDIVLERFPLIVFGLVEDILRDGAEYRESSEALEQLYVSRYLYFVASLLDLPYFVDSFSLFWSREHERQRELSLLLDSAIELLAVLDGVDYSNKEDLLDHARSLLTVNLLWERVIPLRDYLKVNPKVYEITEKFILHLQSKRDLNSTVKYLFLRLYSNVVQLGEESRVQIYRNYNVEDLSASVQIGQKLCNGDRVDVFLQYFIFKRPDLSAFALASAKYDKDVCGLSDEAPIQDGALPRTQLEVARDSMAVLNIYEREVVESLKEMALSSISAKSSLIFIESIGNGLQIYYSLINHIKMAHFDDKHKFRIVRLYLDNTIDSKSLLGNWTVGDVPGEFQWEFGILSLCIMNGDWILVENIQDAPKDVIIKLNEISESIHEPLVIDSSVFQTRVQETKYFELSEFNRKVKIHPNFRIFASCIASRPGSSSSSGSETEEMTRAAQPKDHMGSDTWRLLNDDKWSVLSIPTPTSRELRRGLEVNYQNLSHIKEELLESFSNLVGLMSSSDSLSAAARTLNMRMPSCCDFFKGCERVSRLFFSSSKDDWERSSGFLNERQKMKISMVFGSILLDHIPLRWYRNRCQIEVSRSFGISGKEAEHFLRNGRFDIHFSGSSEQYRGKSGVNIVNKELNIDIGVRLLGGASAPSLGESPSSRQLALRPSHQDHSKYLSYTFTSVHSRVLYKLVTAIYNNENILLVGDTGTGKTTIIQQLHYMLYGAERRHIGDQLDEPEGRCCELLVYNFNDQSESSDIIGSFRPINVYNELKLLYDDYLVLMEKSNISRKKNETIINYLQTLLRGRKWIKFINNLVIIIDKLLSEFDNLLKNQDQKGYRAGHNGGLGEGQAGKDKDSGRDQDQARKSKTKKRAVVSVEDIWTLRIYWRELRQKCLIKLKDDRISNNESEGQKHYFEFLDGILLKAVKEGHWLILDEINLAPIDILQRIIPILNRGSRKAGSHSEIEIVDNNSAAESSCRASQTGEGGLDDLDYLVVPEKGNESVRIHPRFRLFSCMNPVAIPIELKESGAGQRGDLEQVQVKSTSGKKELPQLVRQLFTEYFVDELVDRKDLEDFVYNYLKDVLVTNQVSISALVDIYLEMKDLENRHEITVGLEGSGHGTPNFSLRTFSNCLSYIRTVLLQQSSWRRSQNQLRLVDSVGEMSRGRGDLEAKNGNFIIQNSVLKKEVSEIIHSGVMMSFATPLVCESYNKVDRLVRRLLKISCPVSSAGKSSVGSVSKGPKDVEMSCISFSAPRISSEEDYPKASSRGSSSINYMLIADFVVRMGTYDKSFKLSNVVNNNFVITPYVEQNLRKILRILSGSRNPILIEGETSTGKTSLIRYISELTNHKFVRINNHEHTDTEEYFGKFVPNSHGELEFVEGPLVHSIRNGYWLVLDELNLAPSEVLESLNRLLDSNRELYIPETGETIKAHEDFMLFATQNPAGSIYGGRKLLSQAFRNRFVEIYFDEIPSKELEVFTELKRHRSKSQMFSGDFSFVTVRDLLRWGNRLSTSRDSVFDKKNLVIQGFYVIGERVRDDGEKLQLAEILYNICKPFEIKGVEEIVGHSTSHICNTTEDTSVKKKRRKDASSSPESVDGPRVSVSGQEISLDNFSGPDGNLPALRDFVQASGSYILTDSFKRMLTLVNDCILFNEPVLLVGSTGCGKTSIFQLLSTLYKKQLYIVNCHQQIEASDMLGSLRPVRSKILRLNQELNNFKIELAGAAKVSGDAGLSEDNGLQSGDQMGAILDTVDFLCGLLEESNAGDSPRDGDRYSEKSQRIAREIVSAIASIDSLLGDSGAQIPPEVILLLERLVGELRLYQNHEYTGNQALFEWQDGPIIKAMKTGSFLLLDEINLCDDSVIERLNSLLEDHYIPSDSGRPQKSRVIYLTERGGSQLAQGGDDYVIHSHRDFRVFATMNPSGDYGKRELSPALRNRFNEVFVPTLSICQLRTDLEQLVLRNISQLRERAVSETDLRILSRCIMVFSILYENDIKGNQTLRIGDPIQAPDLSGYLGLSGGDHDFSLVEFVQGSGTTSMEAKEYTIRDIISWCQFVRNNFQAISDFYESNRDVVISHVISSTGKEGSWQLEDRSQFEARILHSLVLGELFVQGACMLIVDGVDHQASGESDFSLQLKYIRGLIDIFYIYQVVPALGGLAHSGVDKAVKDILAFRFLRDQGENWIRVGGGRVLGGEKTGPLLVVEPGFIELGPFKLSRKNVLRAPDASSCSQGPSSPPKEDDGVTKAISKFTFDSRTTLRNLSSIIRSMSIMKPILLEGAPGIGKTAILLTLSKLVGVKLHRVNMSEQTDFSDLFGCEVPSAGREGSGSSGEAPQVCQDSGRFIQWIDGILLHAMKNGDWVILDELNLATQQILEGLNSVMDHRRNIYIPEIGQTVLCHENFRIFATQNPVKIGSSGRKGLPQSFLNRFVKINVGKLDYQDYLVICRALFLDKDGGLTSELIDCCIRITREIELFSLGRRALKDGYMWEWNLRDIIRLLRFSKLNLERLGCQSGGRGVELTEEMVLSSVYCSFETVYLSRLRTREDFAAISDIVKEGLQQLSGADQRILGITDRIIGHGYFGCGTGMVDFKSYLRSYILMKTGIPGQNGSRYTYGNAKALRDFDLNVLPIDSKKRIVSMIDSILLGENLILTCSQGERMQEVVSCIECISRNLFQNVRVNKVNILPSMDANDLIGGYQQYNRENILDEILDLVSSIRLEFPDSSTELQKQETLSARDFSEILDTLRLIKMVNQLRVYGDDAVSVLRALLVSLRRADGVQISPVGVLDEIEARLDNLDLSSSSRAAKGPKFQFTFSTLINSIRNGDWLVITNIQNCSSALLDRLNSLLEDKENNLFIIESGIPQYIPRHENFRLFFVADYNVQNKYISNALVNRCIDIFIDEDSFKRDEGGVSGEDRALLEASSVHLKSIFADVLHRAASNRQPWVGSHSESLALTQSQDDVRETLLPTAGDLVQCEECVQDLVASIVSGSRGTGRLVADFIRMSFRAPPPDCETGDLEPKLAIYLAALMINGVSGYLLKGTASRGLGSCIQSQGTLSALFRTAGVEECRGSLEQVGGHQFLLFWMRSLLSLAFVSPRKSGRVTRTPIFRVLEDSLILSFRRFGLDISRSWLVHLYLDVMRVLEGWMLDSSGQKAQSMAMFGRYYHMDTVFGDISIKRYDHLYEQYRLLLQTVRRDPEGQDWTDFAQIHCFFVVCLRDFLDSGNAFESVLYLVSELESMESQNLGQSVQIKSSYVKSIVFVISRLMGFRLGDDLHYDLLARQTKAEELMLEALREYLPVGGDPGMLTSILSLVLSPVMRLCYSELVEGVLRFTNIFSYALNSWTSTCQQPVSPSAFRTAIRQFMSDPRNYKRDSSSSVNIFSGLGGFSSCELGITFEENRSLEDLLGVCEAFSISVSNGWVLDYLTRVLRSPEEVERSETQDLLQLFQLLQDHILILDLDQSEERAGDTELACREVLRVFEAKIKGGVVSDILRLIEMRLKGEDVARDEDGNVLKVIPRDRSYLETIYSSKTGFLGNGVIVSIGNFGIQSLLMSSPHRVVQYLIGQRVDLKVILEYFTQAQLCNLEFLDPLLGVRGGEGRTSWVQMTHQIEEISRKVDQGIHGMRESGVYGEERGILVEGPQRDDSVLFFEYYIMNQFLRSQIYKGLRSGQIDRTGLMQYLRYIVDLLNIYPESHHFYMVGMATKIIRILSVSDSYSIYSDYYRRAESVSSFNLERLEWMRRNHLMAILMDLDTVYDFEIEGSFVLSHESLQEDLMVDLIKDSFIVLSPPGDIGQTSVHSQSSATFCKDFERLLKLLMKFDKRMMKPLLLNFIYYRLYNFKFYQINHLRGDYLLLFYYLNNQEVIEPQSNTRSRIGLEVCQDGNIQNSIIHFTTVIFDFLEFIGIEQQAIKQSTVEYLGSLLYSRACSYSLEVAVSGLHKLSKVVSSDRVGIFISDTLLERLRAHFLYLSSVFKPLEQGVKVFELLTRTCLVVIEIPVYYHCRNLLYIDEARVFQDYQTRVSRQQNRVEADLRSHYLEYFHHIYSVTDDQPESSYQTSEHPEVVRRLGETLDDPSRMVISQVSEILGSIRENALIREIGSSHSCTTSLHELENFTIFIQNMLGKSSSDLFQPRVRLFYGDILDPIRFLANSLLYGVAGLYLFERSEILSISSYLRGNLPKNYDQNFCIILDNYEYERFLDLRSLKESSIFVDLWNSFLEVGNYIHEYNSIFQSLYIKYCQDFEYNTQKTDEQTLEAREDENGYDGYADVGSAQMDHLVYRNDQIDKFIEANHILNEFDRMNELINQSSDALKSNLKYNNIKLVCLKIMEVLILRFGFNEFHSMGSFESFNKNDRRTHPMEKYIHYNSYYNHISLPSESPLVQNSQHNFWRFILLQLNHYQIFSREFSFGFESDSYYQHIKIHVNDETFYSLVNGNNTNELAAIISLVERIQLVQKLKEMQSQVKSLLTEYHDQPILSMIKDILEKILMISARKISLVNLICYLDILFARLFKWQEYVKEGLNLNIETDHSVLLSHIDFVKYSIYELRKLQISSWIDLIFRTYQKYNFMASFSLGSILVIISRIFTDYQDFNHHLVFHEILDYLKSSSKGEFPIRFLFIKYIHDLISRILDHQGVISLSLSRCQLTKLIQLSKIFVTVLDFGEVIYREILSDNQRELLQVKREIKDIIKLSIWKVHDYSKIKKNILSIQRQLKKSLLRFDEKLSIKISQDGQLNSNIVHIFPGLNDFIERNEFKCQEGIGFIIKLLSDVGNKDKMLKQRYYKVLIDKDTYGLDSLVNISSFNDFYYNNLYKYMNDQRDYLVMTDRYKDSMKGVINRCFLLLDQLRMNEGTRYNFNYMNQSLIDYNRLLSVGNTLLSNLLAEYYEFYMGYSWRRLVSSYIVSIQEERVFCLISGSIAGLDQERRISYLEYLNCLIRIWDHLEMIKMILLCRVDESCFSEKGRDEFLVRDKVSHDKRSGEVVEFIQNRIMEGGLLDMISRLREMFYISDLISSKHGLSYLILNMDLMKTLEKFNIWIRMEVDELVSMIKRSYLNIGVMELDDLNGYLDKLGFVYMDFNLGDRIIDVDMDELDSNFISKAKCGEDGSLITMFRLTGLCDKYKEEYDSRNSALKSLSRTTLEYIESLYILLENEFFNLCKEEDDDDDNACAERDSGVDWKSGNGFGDKDDKDDNGKDISNELNNDDSLLEGLKSENEKQSEMESNGGGKKDGVDTELDFNSRLEDLEEDKGEGRGENDEEDDSGDTEEIFDNVDLENKNSKIEDVKRDEDDDENDEDEERDDEKEKDNKENIETKSKNGEENSQEGQEHDIVAKMGNGEDEDDEREDENSKDEDSKENEEDTGKDEEAQINSMESDLDELFEYDAKKINPHTNEEDDADDSNRDGDGENGDCDEIDDDLSVSSMTGGSDDGSGEEGGDDLDQENMSDDDQIQTPGRDQGQDQDQNQDEMSIDRYQSSGNNNMEDDNQEGENRFDSRADQKGEKGSQGLGSVEDLEEDRDKDKDGMEKEEDAEMDNGGDDDDDRIENEEERGLGDGFGGEMEEGAESGPSEPKREDGEEIMNPLLEENLEQSNDWYKSLREMIVKDEVMQEGEETEGQEMEMNEGHSSFKIDRSADSRSNMVENLPTYEKGGSSGKDVKEEREKRHLDTQVLKQRMEDVGERMRRDEVGGDEERDGSIFQREETDREEDAQDVGSVWNREADDLSGVLKCREDLGCGCDQDLEEGVEFLDREEDRAMESCVSGGSDMLSNRMETWNRIQGEISATVNLLSNQLGIILEPTIRGKMEGGFKTGKKLSMKKVIAYIASDYRKDKIWLRRSKPSKREFNVLMCIDNSQSMSVSRNEYMALQSMFIIIQSLQKIEVGNFGVCSFTGDNIQQLVEMTSQISSSDAVDLLSRFSFSEETQDSHQSSIPNILKYSTDLLKEFNSRKSAGKQCHQLIIIITDGRFNKSKANVWVNYAIQNNCVPVLIIIDNVDGEMVGDNGNKKSSSSSIFNMKSVNKDEDGRMVVTPYLEHFPFPYYSVIQDPRTLPNVLCELIKQWFELICS